MHKVDMLMPQLGESINEATVVKWLKKEGEAIEKDEIILEISTDKVDSEIPSPHKGVLASVMASEGDTVAVGAVIAQIETDAAVASQPAARPASPEPAPVPQQAAAPPAVTPASSGSLAEMLMPQLGEGITDGTVVRWLKKENEFVAKDEIILEISTDKVDSEIPSPHEGKVVKLMAAEGDTVAVGSVIAQISTGADVSGIAPPAEQTPAQPARSEAVDGVKAASISTQPAPVKVMSVPAAGAINGERRFYSPLVRRIARAEGVGAAELATVPGTGAHGRVTKKDILSYLERRTPSTVAVQETAADRMPVFEPSPSLPAPADVTVATQAAVASSTDRTEVLPMDSMRKSIAQHMVQSVQTSPHVFMVDEADLTELVAWRSANKDAFLQKTGTKLTYIPFITMACAKVLQDFPLVNSSLHDNNIIRKKYINIGIAVALENNGLIVPVIRDADGLNTVGLARAINDLAARARSKKLKPDEVQDGTFSITNMGSFGSLMGFPIINQPQVAILGVGTIQKRPVVVDNAIAIRDMMYISLSFDHRLVDGALAGQFLSRVAHYLNNVDVNNIL